MSSTYGYNKDVYMLMRTYNTSNKDVYTTKKDLYTAYKDLFTDKKDVYTDNKDVYTDNKDVHTDNKQSWIQGGGQGVDDPLFEKKGVKIIF